MSPVGLLGLRWLFLAAALWMLARFLAASRTAGGLGASLALLLAWAVLSWLKARSLDSPRPR